MNITTMLTKPATPAELFPAIPGNLPAMVLALNERGEADVFDGLDFDPDTDDSDLAPYDPNLDLGLFGDDQTGDLFADSLSAPIPQERCVACGTVSRTTLCDACALDRCPGCFAMNGGGVCDFCMDDLMVSTRENERRW